MRNTLRKSYASFGINIPNSAVKYLGKGGGSSSAKKTYKFTNTPKGLLINSRAAKHPSVSIEELRKIAKNLNVKNEKVLKGRSKAAIIESIRTSAKNKGLLKNTNVNFDPNRPFMSTASRKKGLISTMKKGAIMKLALSDYGIRLTPDMSIEAMKAEIAKVGQRRVNNRKAALARTVSSNSNMSNFAKNLNEAMASAASPKRKSPPKRTVSSSSSNSNMSNFAKNLEATLKQNNNKKLKKMASANVEKM
jgi:hypothetical protein